MVQHSSTRKVVKRRSSRHRAGYVPDKLKKLALRCKVRLTHKVGGHRMRKSVALLKAQCKRKLERMVKRKRELARRMARASAKGKTQKTKRVHKSRKPRRSTHRARRSKFSVNYGSGILLQTMGPYPSMSFGKRNEKFGKRSLFGRRLRFGRKF